MGLFRTTKYFIVGHKILKILLIDNWENVKINDKEITQSIPAIYDVSFIYEKISNQLYPNDVIRDAIDLLKKNDHLNFKMENLINRNEGKLHITKLGIKAYKESFYLKQIIIKWWKFLGISIVIIFSIIKWGIPYLRTKLNC